MSILIIGGTGTLGRQVTRELIDAGFEVSCLINNISRAKFLGEWGARLYFGDLRKPETFPRALKGCTTVIDISTRLPEEDYGTLMEVDLIGKIALIKAAQVANVKGYVFFSIKDNNLFQGVPLMRLKTKVERTLQESRIPYMIIRLSGFYQGLINQYAIPILEKQTIFTTDDSKNNAYINSQDVAKILTKSLAYTFNSQNLKLGQIITINGPKAWNSGKIIKLCEELAGQKAELKYTSIGILSFIRKLMLFSEWTWDIHDRLAFTEVLSNDFESELTAYKIKPISKVESKKPNDGFNIKLYEQDMTPLETYFEEYFENMLKKLKDLNYDQNKAIKRKDLRF
jgi:uncharacterized protein YbjT (DUF2867 family)